MKISKHVSLITAGLIQLGVAQAATIAKWTFETSVPALTDSSTIGSLSAEIGTGTASGFHASLLTDWSNPVGNNSSESLSSNNWAQNDYYQFTTSTVGFSNIVFSFDQTRSSTGPSSFNVAYSTNGTSFTDLAGSAYTVVASTGTNIVYSDATNGASWTSSKLATNTSYSFSLSAITTLNNVPNVYLRLVQTGSGIATTGTNRVDNIEIAGTAIPEPSTFAAILGGVALAGVAARRRRSV
jgi:hypothetical protein